MAKESVDGSTYKALAIAPSDTVRFTRTRGIYVGTAGNVSLVMADGANTVVFVSAAAGITHPWGAIGVNATGTTATNLVAVF
jgi:hypothetical protein